MVLAEIREQDSGMEFLEFSDFPRMDGGDRLVDQIKQDLGDRVVVVQAPDHKRSRKEEPDVSWWGSYFTFSSWWSLRGDKIKVHSMSKSNMQLGHISGSLS